MKNELQDRWDNARPDPKREAELDAGDRAEAEAAAHAEIERAESELVARTILEQLGGLGRLQAMTGATGIGYDGRSLSFKFPNRRGPNYCKITLDPSDTYSVLFGRIRKHVLTQRRSFEGIYWDGLVGLFESTTGLRLSL